MNHLIKPQNIVFSFLWLNIYHTNRKIKQDKYKYHRVHNIWSIWTELTFGGLKKLSICWPVPEILAKTRRHFFQCGFPSAARLSPAAKFTGPSRVISPYSLNLWRLSTNAYKMNRYIIPFIIQYQVYYRWNLGFKVRTYNYV